MQITDAIKGQAATLHNNPVEIFNWVRNNIDFVPTYGSIQGSDLTLQAQRGNAYDTASLLIALLRASGIPARYVYGSVEIPATPLMSWAGGFDNPQAAVDFLGQGGIPITALAQGGTIQAARIEHVWVEAWVSYRPSRGAKSGGGYGWVPMDASFKAYQDVTGVAPTAATPDLQAAVQTYAASAQTGDGGAWSTGYDPTAFDQYRAGVSANMTPTVVADPSLITSNQILPTRTIVAVQSPVLPATLPYHLVARGGDYASLPSSLKVSAQVELFTLADETAGNPPVISQQISLPEMGFSSLELTYSPATAADASAWAAYQTPGTTEFPAYLIQVNASLKLAGTDLQDSASLPFGQDMVLHVTYGGAAQSRDARFAMLSGDEVQVGLDGDGQAASLGMAFNGRTDLGTVENNLFTVSKAFWIQQDTMDAQLAQINRTAFVRMPSAAAFSSPVSIVYNYGVPFSASYHGHGVDVKLAQYSAMSRDGDAQKTQAFSLLSGIKLSGTEAHAVEEVFGGSLGKGVSTVGLIAFANASGMPIYHITAANWGTYRSVLQHPTDVLTDIDNAVGAGLDVIIPQTQLTYGSWIGSGYIILDPTTGSGDYRINGGASGSFTDSCGRKTAPVKVSVPDVSIIWEMILQGYVDDNLDFDGDGVAAMIALCVAVAALVVVAGAAAAVAVAVAGESLSTAALVLMVGMSQAANAAAADDCDCTPRDAKYQRGGHPAHNDCANLYTTFPGRDRILNGHNYDGEVEPGKLMTEVKTGLSYGVFKKIAAKNPHNSSIFMAAAILAEQIGIVVRDTGLAGVCEYDYGYFAEDPEIVADVQKWAAALASKVHPAQCP